MRTEFNNLEVISDKSCFHGEVGIKALLDWIQEKRREENLETTSINNS